ncbi:MAG: hypothetical protein UY92_C0008G0010 [Candidatus Magasanikbacteria bacterium GW2011_GWA2_56_11]|uniref:DUF11 domain-containing protein n=1 Tax=Candidatus Magasanikbacteria bacterium GW2011_GWA2_56_11 TaxID=1619044 RepID=A0A0G2BA00_9BACT|nr:MAG: hypothetical protein UY92_C0008G0010 [Candidatus Magasanikbacteria bacterium GW2011_GWA2_56_11]
MSPKPKSKPADLPPDKAAIPAGERHFVKKTLSPETSVEAAAKGSPRDESQGAPPSLTVKGQRKSGSFRDDRVTGQLLSIYENSDGTLPDMKTFEKRASHSVWRVFAFGVAAFLTAAGIYFGWQTFFSPGTKFSANDVLLSLIGPERIAVADEVTFRIRYRNSERVPLDSAQLEVAYPAGFAVSRVSLPADNEAQTVWKLGTLEAGAGGEVEISGRLYGSLGETQSLRTFLNYTPSNFNSEFQKIATLSVALTESPIEFTVSSPESVAPGEAARFVVSLRPRGASAVPLFLTLDPGPLFEKKQSSLESDQNEPYRWTLGSLSEAKEIDLSGVFAPAAAATEQKLTFQVLGRLSGKPDSAPFVMASLERPVRVLESSLETKLAINGATEKLALSPGDTLNATIAVKNNGSSDFPHARVRFVIDAPAYNDKSILYWNKLEEAHNGQVVGEKIDDATRRGIITWSEEQVPELARLKPGEEVVFEVALPLKSGVETSLVNYATHRLLAQLEVQYEGANAPEVRRGGTIDMTLNSDLAIEVRDEISALDSDTYRVTWLLTNSFHELKDIILEAEVYGDVSVAESEFVVPAGTAVFDQKTGRLTWRLDSLPTSVDVAALEFTLKLNQKNPTQENLTSKVRVTATDAVTGETVERAGEEILL